MHEVVLVIIFIVILPDILCKHELVVVKLKDFPKDQIALHMPCEESNMFATKCMCHIKCKDSSCSNAKILCEKYSDSKGCKFVLLRDIGKTKIATLKRVPTVAELSNFDPKMYESTNHSNSTSALVGLLVMDTSQQSLRDLVAYHNVSNLTERIISEQDSKAPFCGYSLPKSNSLAELNVHREGFLKSRIALVALNYRAPRTLLNSLKTWNSSGLLSMVSERILILNDPYPSEISMATDHGFRILEPKTLPSQHLAKENVVTIGAAFYYALKTITSEYLLFLENDFKMDVTLSRKTIATELITAAGMLARGAEVVRLQSRKYQGCGYVTCICSIHIPIHHQPMSV